MNDFWSKLTSGLNQYAEKFFSPRISIRYKLTIPIFLMMILMVFLSFRTTYRTVRDQVTEFNEERLIAITRIFAETTRVSARSKNSPLLLEHLRWMTERPDVLGIRLETPEDTVSVGDLIEPLAEDERLADPEFSGARKVAQGTYAVAIFLNPMRPENGRLIIFFDQPEIEMKLKKIFIDRLLMTFLMAMGIIFVISGFIWLALRPLAVLKNAAERILIGDLGAYADIRTLDEIQDLAEVFNEMMNRLNRSFDSLRTRTEALQESEEKYRSIVEHERDMIFQLNAAGEFILLNQGFSGYTKDEFYREGLDLFLRICTERSREEFKNQIQRIYEAKIPVMNISIVHEERHAGEEVFYLINLTPILDQHKQVKMIQGVMRDVTELRRIEKMKDSLIRDVAHELKTPTAKFEMGVYLFEKEIETNPAMRQYKPLVGMLKHNTERLMKTILSIMDLSKLESGMEKLEKVPMDLNEVLKLVVQDMRPLCEKKGIDLESSLCVEKIPMMGDRDKIYRVFVNLISNALKFTEKGSVTIISWKDETHAVVSVADTGCGIEKEDLGKIFERFFQKTPASEGVGVGLTISRDIVHMHGGDIWAESQGLGKGATFKVRFPLA